LTQTNFLRIGTRGSLLAIAQARIVLNFLQTTFPQDPFVQKATLVTVTTTGDRVVDRPLHEIGRKGLFVKELEQALQTYQIDFAVHSLKDIETILPTGIKLGAVLLREDARDAMLSFKANSLMKLPFGSIVGTCSPRRIAQILYHRPDLRCVPLRGNVDTRIRKLQEGQMDAIILALAGLKRLGREAEATYVFPESEILPAVGQGALALECREDDTRTQSYLAALNHEDTHRCIIAERTLLAYLGASCKTPVGGHATILPNGKIHLEALIATSTGQPLYRTTQVGDDPISLGAVTAKILNERAGPDFWSLPCIS